MKKYNEEAVVDSLDLLLQKAFQKLDFNDSKNEKVLEALSNNVFQTKPTITFYEKVKNLLNPKNSFIMIGTIVTSLIMGYFLLDNSGKLSELQPIIEINKSEVILLNDDSTQNESSFISSDIYENVKPIKKLDAIVFNNTINRNETIRPLQKIDWNISELETEEVETKEDTVYVFPKLTSEQKEENEIQKAKMLKQLVKLDKKKYVLIPSGTATFPDGTKLSMQSIYMQSTEVSNLEFRTFLFDLLIQNRKEEFLIAKPDQSKWSERANYFSPYEKHYFSHPAYDNYPIVNVSREGAEMYCKWLTIEKNKIENKKGKINQNDVRLPSKDEWVYSASSGGEQFPYPWGGPYLRNSKGVYLANFHVETDTTVQQMFNNNGADVTAPVLSYAPNNFGLYNMSGNVSEMIYYKNDKNIPGTKGGHWMSISQEIQINGPDPFRNKVDPSIFIGFRPVISAEQ